MLVRSDLGCAARQFLGLPVPVPEMDTLAGDAAELAGDLGLARAGGEQLGGAQPTDLEAVTLC